MNCFMPFVMGQIISNFTISGLSQISSLDRTISTFCLFVIGINPFASLNDLLDELFLTHT